MPRSMSVSRLTRSLRLPSLALALGAAIFVTGCGEQGGPRVPVFPVSGEVQIEGEKPAGAVVVFHATNAGAPTARGTVGPDGKFKLSTYETGDGAAPGEYKVTVSLFKVVQKEGSAVPGPNVLPDKFSKPDATPLKVTVAAGPNDLAPLVVKK